MRKITAVALAAAFAVGGCENFSGTSISNEAADELVFEADTRQERVLRAAFIVMAVSEKAFVEAIYGDGPVASAVGCIDAAHRRISRMLDQDRVPFFESNAYRASLACQGYIKSDVLSIISDIGTPGFSPDALVNAFEQAGALRSAALDARYIYEQYEAGELSQEAMVKAVRGRIEANLEAIRGVM